MKSSPFCNRMIRMTRPQICPWSKLGLEQATKSEPGNLKSKNKETGKIRPGKHFVIVCNGFVARMNRKTECSLFKIGF